MTEHQIGLTLEEMKSLLCVDYSKKDEHRNTAVAKLHAILKTIQEDERNQMFGGWTYTGPNEDGRCLVNNRKHERIATVPSKAIAFSLCHHHDFAYTLEMLTHKNFRDKLHANYSDGHQGNESKVFHHGIDATCNAVAECARAPLRAAGWIEREEEQ